MPVKDCSERFNQRKSKEKKNGNKKKSVQRSVDSKQSFPPRSDFKDLEDFNDLKVRPDKGNLKLTIWNLKLFVVSQ